MILFHYGGRRHWNVGKSKNLRVSKTGQKAKENYRNFIIFSLQSVKSQGSFQWKLIIKGISIIALTWLNYKLVLLRLQISRQHSGNNNTNKFALILIFYEKPFASASLKYLSNTQTKSFWKCLSLEEVL